MSSDHRQTSLFDAFEASDPADNPADGSLDVAAELCGTLAAAIKVCPFSRAEIAARMSDLTGKPISEDMLNQWTAKSAAAWRFPFEFAPAFEVATGTQCLQLLMARKRGTVVMTKKESRDAEIGRTQRELREMQKRLRALMGAR
ncbi:hypothetical protein HDIA_2235 [Hartmannibacter diazotrophicus]|uniref:Uncharacterized protein n=1 Tax=Hartmannibacter diazotrophicus TaxID=1482074 RepID=A0A2C9D654_9HYPH|nr:hypothetical protein [Hartmannibacter diazotrophicus]SON55776.1 hypothetical protein HDIA_2235 [Hartmannibacter diazotrophicus]